MAGDSPVFVYNDDSQGVKVHSLMVRCMETCDRFDLSVAFITMGRLCTLFQSFRNMGIRGVKGRILTTDYLGFNDPQALEWLLKHTDFDIKVCEGAFHTKGYMFYTGDTQTTLVGSSNLTDTALCTNLEWNLKIVSSRDDPISVRLRSEFERMWSGAAPLTQEWIDGYRARRPTVRRQASAAISGTVPKPNAMQTEALESLRSLRDDGKFRALLISATGTGKTYLSAFDVRDFAPKRFLFLVHNENILKAAIQSYRAVLGNSYTYGLYTGNEKDGSATAMFSTIQTMSRHMERFPRDHFDYIVCDEAHHSTAGMYSRIICYFTPRFMLGMTATPERMDDADVFRMFDYNVAYEIRLGRALEMGILCPFHYYGVSEILVDGAPIDDDSDFNDLTSDERVRNIIEKAEYYKPHGDKVHGLIFCSSVREAEVLSNKLNLNGYRTLSLNGDDSIDARKDAIARLRMDSGDCLDYILTYNVFNEGVDIPEVNQVLMLRPTQSAIVFVQQLGRGLRRTSDPDKSLIVLDFIGNYKNNFMIPMALSGDRSHDKDNLRRFMMSKNLPGCSTVGFEKIVEERILTNISRTNLSKLAMLKSEYLSLRVRLNHPPSLCDFLHGGSIDPTVIVDYAGNINRFREKMHDGDVHLSKEEDDALTYISSFVSGKRPHELAILKALVECGELNIDRDLEGYDKASLESAIRVLDGRYLTKETLKNHPSWRLIERDGGLICPTAALRSMSGDPGIRSMILDVLDCGLEINSSSYSDVDDLGFVLYQKYSRSDVCRLLNWETDCSSTMYGYMLKNDQCPIFVTYQKSTDISSTTMYADGFEDRCTFRWMTKSGRTMSSPKESIIIDSASNGLKVPVFVKKNDSEGTGFYYIGQAKAMRSEATEGTIGGKKVVEVPLHLVNEVPNELYDYLTADAACEAAEVE